MSGKTKEDGAWVLVALRDHWTPPAPCLLSRHAFWRREKWFLKKNKRSR